MIGFGALSVGSAPAGIGEVERAPKREGGVLVDREGNGQSARLLNIQTGRYELDESGRYVGLSAVAQRVQLALTTDFGSSSQFNVGIAATSGVIGQNFAAKRRATILQALAPLIADKSIEVLSVDVDASKRPIYTRILWRDLTMQREQATQI